MNLLLIIIVIFLILIYLNYNKLNINKKKVSWNPDNNIVYQQNDINNIETYDPLNKDHESSKISIWLQENKNSYPNAVNINQPKTASIPIAPPKNIMLYNSRDIINTIDSNIRTTDLHDNHDNQNILNQDKTIGSIYDSLVDNYRLEWGQINNGNSNIFDGKICNNNYNSDNICNASINSSKQDKGLQAFDNTNNYDLNTNPQEMGYTDFATY